MEKIAGYLQWLWSDVERSAEDYGLCNHCGLDRDLTREHIPPRSAGNAEPTKASTAESFLSPAETEFVEHSEGYTVKTLCSQCNARGDSSGTVREYSRVREFVVEEARNRFQSDGTGMLAGPNGATIELPYDFMPSRFSRQLIGMLLATQIDPTMVFDLDVLRNVCLSSRPTAGELSSLPWRLGLSLINVVPGVSKAPIVQRRTRPTLLWTPSGSMTTDHQVLLAVLPPFLVTLVHGGEPMGLDVTEWVAMEHSERLSKQRRVLHLQNGWAICPQLLEGMGYNGPQR